MIKQNGPDTKVEGYFTDIVAEYSTLTYALLNFCLENMSSEEALEIFQYAFDSAIAKFKEDNKLEGEKGNE